MQFYAMRSLRTITLITILCAFCIQSAALPIVALFTSIGIQHYTPAGQREKKATKILHIAKFQKTRPGKNKHRINSKDLNQSVIFFTDVTSRLFSFGIKYHSSQLYFYWESPVIPQQTPPPNFTV